MFTTSVRRSLIFLALILLSINQSVAQTDPSSSSTGASIYQPVITRVSGCEDVGDRTLRCPRGAQILLTVYGSGFLLPGSSTKSYGIELTQGVSSLGHMDALTVNDTCITGRWAALYGQFMNANLVNVSVWYQYQIYGSVLSLSFTDPIPLTLTQVTGCASSDGLTASGCNYMNTITMIGTGFSMIAADDLELRMKTASYQISRVMPTGAVRIISDTMMLYNPANTSLLLPPDVYNQPVTITFKSSTYTPRLPWALDPMYISYSSIPAVEVTGISVLNDQGCVSERINGMDRLTGCFAGRTALRISGRFMWFGTEVYIGGVFVPVIPANGRFDSIFMTIYLPIMDTTAGVYYDIRIVNPVTELVLSNVINFVSTTEIASMTPCVKKQSVTGDAPAWKAFCLEGEIFSFTAVNIYGQQLPKVFFGPHECPDVRLDDRILSCTVPRDPDGTASVRDGLFLSWPDHNSSSVQFELWDHPLAPRITQFTGPDCYQSANLSKPLQCLLGLEGRNLTILTSRLPVQPKWSFILYYNFGVTWGSARMTDVSVDAETGAVTCWLEGNWRGALTDDVIYQIAVSANSVTPDSGSNVLPLQLVSEITYDADVQKSHALTIALAIILPLLAVLAIGLLFWRYQRSKSHDKMMVDNNSSDAMKRIEMA